jgi:hypothetical protein
MSKGRGYTRSTLKKLYALSGNQCAFPGCNKTLVNKNNAKDSNICHIEAAKKGGERYNPKMTDEERADYPNLILFCIQHHDETNNVEKYTVQKLKEMKSAHEAEISLKINPQRNVDRHPSVLTDIINIISKKDIEEFQEIAVKNAFRPEDKIKYNDVKRYKSIIEEYKVYQGKLNKIYTEIESQGSIRKISLLKNIRSYYLEAKYHLLGSDPSIENIRLRADDLIEYVENKLYKLIDESQNKADDLDIETIIYGVKIVIVDAFLRCNILEEEKHDN